MSAPVRETSAAGRPRRIIEAAILALLLIAIGTFCVPAHMTSNWWDYEFTGWVAPIANQVAEGQRLYADGGHGPMPPLSFLTLRWLFGNRSIWLAESALDFGFRAALILVLYLGLSRYLPSPAPFLGALAALPLYVSLQKVMLYDAEAQFLAALAIVIVARAVEEPEARSPAFLAGVVSALCVLTKQSTGIGLAGSATVALLALAGRRTAAVYVASLLLVAAGSLVAISPWADPAGMISDTLIHGSAPKGGLWIAAANLQGYARDAGVSLLAPAIVVGGLVWGFGTRLGVDAERTWLVWVAFAAAALGCALVVREAGLFDPAAVPNPRESRLSPVLGAVPLRFAYAGMAIGVIGGALSLGGLGGLGARGRALAAAFAVAAGAAVGHSLSVGVFRWLYDTNPLVLICFALVFAVASALPGRLGAVVAISTVALVQVACWSTVGHFLDGVRQSTDTWPEVSHLAGSRMRPGASGMRTLVGRVRELAEPLEAVLLLPNDPEVEAWFERPRPHLTSSIVFVDQYWDRYVDEDFRRLRADPPKVIVLGPREIARTFPLLWNGIGRGADRLSRRVQAELLPRRYELAQSIRVETRWGTAYDWMDVWVRR